MTDHETKRVDIRGKDVVYGRGGSGESLLYLHSAAGETAMFGDPWLPYLDRLAADFDVIAPVHPGFGDSGGLDQIDDVLDLVFHYDDFMTALGVPRAHVLGLSLGGWIGAELAVFFPDRVSKLILMDAAGLWVQDHPIAEIFGIMPDETAHLMFHKPEQHPIGQLLLAQAGAMETGLPRGIDPEALMPMIRALSATAKVGWNPYLHDPKLPERLHRVQATTLCLWGEEDTLIPAAHADDYARYIPDCTVRKLSGVGHMVPFEAEDAFVEEVVGFLRP